MITTLGERWADTSTSTGRFDVGVLAGLADVERNLIRTQTAEGRRRAEAKGQPMGRPLPRPGTTERGHQAHRRRQAILTVKAEHVATFLGHKITPQLAQEIGSQFATRIEGTCVKHRFGKSSIKLYDKFGLVLRIETTTNDISAFKHYRKVEHQQGPASYALAPVKKNIYSLTALAHILLGCNRRYLEYLSSLDDFSAGIRALDRLTQPRPVNGRTLRGLNFFSHPERTLLAALQRPAFNIAGLRRADLLPLLTPCSPATLTRHLARLRQLGVIKRVTGTYRYYLTRAGRAAIAAGRRLTEHTIIPALANKLCSLLANTQLVSD